MICSVVSFQVTEEAGFEENKQALFSMGYAYKHPVENPTLSKENTPHSPLSSHPTVRIPWGPLHPAMPSGSHVTCRLSCGDSPTCPEPGTRPRAEFQSQSFFSYYDDVKKMGDH